MNNTSNYRFTLDIQSTMSQASLPIRFGDTNRKLYITITEGGHPYILHDGFTAAFVGKKADGKHLFNHCIIENRSVVRYDFTDQTANVAGIVDCEIRIYDPEGLCVTSPKFVMVVDERVVYDGEVALSEEQTTKLDNIIATEQKRVEAEEDRTEAFAAFMEESALRMQELSDKYNVAIATAGKRVVEITLLASAWVGTASPYSQVVQIDSITEYSKVDILPSAEQLVEFQKKDLALVTENEDGVITVFAIGTKPTQNWTVQATVTEVSV